MVSDLKNNNLHPSEKHAFSPFSLFRIIKANDTLKSVVTTVETVQVTMMRLGMRAAATKKTSQCLAGIIIDLRVRLTSVVKSQACLRPDIRRHATKMTSIVEGSLAAEATRGPRHHTPRTTRGAGGVETSTIISLHATLSPVSITNTPLIMSNTNQANIMLPRDRVPIVNMALAITPKATTRVTTTTTETDATPKTGRHDPSLATKTTNLPQSHLKLQKMMLQAARQFSQMSKCVVCASLRPCSSQICSWLRMRLKKSAKKKNKPPSSSERDPSWKKLKLPS